MILKKRPDMTILEEAQKLTSGARQKSYGHPYDNHTNTANFWSEYLARKYGLSVRLTGRDVCMMMILLKISRDANKEQRDSLVDVAGYARNAEMIDEKTTKDLGRADASK